MTVPAHPFTAGEIRRVLIVPETTYATTPAVGSVATLTYAGDIETFNNTTDEKVTPIYTDGSRSFGTQTRGAQIVGFTWKGFVRDSVDTFGSFLCKYAFGAYDSGTTTATLADALPSFSCQISKRQWDTAGAGAWVYDYNLYNGCKINKLTITGNEPGMALEIEVEVFAQSVAKSTTKAFTGLQALTLGADPSDDTGVPVRWNGASAYNIGGGAVTMYPEKFKVVVNNNIQRSMGILSGNSGGPYCVTTALNEGRREITYEFTQELQDDVFTAAKRAGTAITTVTFVHSGTASGTLTLTNGIFMANDYPTLIQDVNKESVKMMFKTIGHVGE